MLRRTYVAEGLDANVALWRTLLYVGWYSLASAETVRVIYPEPAMVDPARLPVLLTGVERRGFRGDAGRAQVAKFLNGALKAAESFGGLVGWVDGLTNRDNFSPPYGDTDYSMENAAWARVRRRFEELPNAGPWASYKWADLLKNVHDIDIDAPDIGSKLGETAGPIPGMVKLTGLPWQECAGTPAHQRALLAEARAARVPFGGLDQLETSLCDFNSLLKGGYYVGHDIDSQQVSLPPSMCPAREVFPSRYRGELMGWTGVRPGLKTAYRDTGRLVNL